MHNDVVGREDVRSANARSVLEALMISGPLSRADLARRVSLSAATVTKVVRALLLAGLCREVDVDAPSTGGRPPQPVDVDVDFAHFVGVKLTGSALFIVVTDARGRVLQEVESPLEGNAPELVVDQISRRADALHQRDPRIAAVGIALSGTAMRASPTVATSPFLHWHDVPLATMVADRTGLPVVLENDVRAVTAAEQWFGAGAELDSFALLTLGAGIGCGIVVHGRQVDGHLGASGLVGHLRVGEGAALCYAGHVDCANAYATTGGISRRLSASHGRALTFENCLDLLSDGDAPAREVFDSAGRAVGTLLATVVNLMGPERVLIAGEGVDIFDRARDLALSRLRGLLHWTATEVAVESLPFGFSEWARGAAVVAIQDHVDRLTAAQPTGQRPSSSQTSRGAA